MAWFSKKSLLHLWFYRHQHVCNLRSHPQRCVWGKGQTNHEIRESDGTIGKVKCSQVYYFFIFILNVLVIISINSQPTVFVGKVLAKAYLWFSRAVSRLDANLRAQFSGMFCMSFSARLNNSISNFEIPEFFSFWEIWINRWPALILFRSWVLSCFVFLHASRKRNWRRVTLKRWGV